jgi:hypothetical protein
MQHFNHVQDDFIAFLAETFEWSNAETAENASVLFPSLAVASQLHNDGGGLQSGSTAAAPLPPQVVNQQQLLNGPPPNHELNNHQALQQHTLLPAGFAFPNSQESAALSAQILLLQAQHLQHLQHQQHLQQQQQQHLLQHQQQEQAASSSLFAVSAPEVQHDAEGSAQGQCSGRQQQQQGQERQQQQQQQQRRRGRPPKEKGRYCKGYETVMKSRRRNKSMVSSPAHNLLLLLLLPTVDKTHS